MINSKEEEIQIITRNAYLYGAGITIFAFIVLMIHAWGFYLAETLGMKHRVLFIAAIYEKARIIPRLCIFCYLAISYMHT